MVRALVCLVCSIAFAETGNDFVYQVFVRSFADTAADSDRIGDLRGLRENLDYIAALNVGILWLMPVFPSESYHGYDISDYRGINRDYGTLQDMDDLITAAHRRGIRIVLDIAFNHTSTAHPWFQQALKDPASSYRRFYHFGSKERYGYRAIFGRNMPDLNLAEPKLRNELKAIAKFWLDRGIDGFRLDAAKHIFGDTFGPIAEADLRRNNDWWREFTGYVRSVNPKAVLVGEVLGEPQVLSAHAPGLNALLDAPFMHAARSWIAKPTPGFLTKWKQETASFTPFLFLGTHDENPRLATFFEDRNVDVDAAYRLGMCLLMSIATHPVIYNGDELMQRGRKRKGNPPDHPDEPGDGSRIYDETLREPFPWYKTSRKEPQTAWFEPRFDKPNDGVSVEEQNKPGTMLSLVRALSRLRAEFPDFASGTLASIRSDTAGLLAFEKGGYLVLINPTADLTEYRLDHPGQILFWSDGKRKTWRREDKRKAVSTVGAAPFGFLLLRAKTLR